jgi:hypothetical protein
MGRDVAADEIDAADDFVAGHDGIPDAGNLGVDHMKIGPANAARTHPDTDLSVAGDGIGALDHFKGHVRSRQHHGAHRFLQKEPATRGRIIHKAASR